MAKKRKPAAKITVIPLEKEKEQPPKCFGEKETYCNPDLCGKEWFESCSKK